MTGAGIQLTTLSTEVGNARGFKIKTYKVQKMKERVYTFSVASGLSGFLSGWNFRAIYNN